MVQFRRYRGEGHVIITLESGGGADFGDYEEVADDEDQEDLQYELVMRVMSDESVQNANLRTMKKSSKMKIMRLSSPSPQR